MGAPDEGESYRQLTSNSENRRHEVMPSYAVPCRECHQTAKFHLVSHFVTASSRGEADCSLRPGGEGGATRRMRASLTVSSHQIQRIGGMRSCRPTQRIETPRRAVFPHTAADNIKPQDFTSQSGVSHTTPRKKER